MSNRQKEVGCMGRFVNPDNSAFQVALNSRIYVDKTGLIEYTNSVLDTTNAYICNSRPRRFGKSYAANMLAAYYSKGADSEQMFSGLRISKDADFKKHLNKYDVIHIDIQWFLANCDDADNIVKHVTEAVLDELREVYPDVLPLEVSGLPDALSRIKDKVGQKFVVIIDEWDVLIRDESSDLVVQEEYINFLRGMFKGNEPTKFLHLAFLTGILPIKKVKTQSALNNFDEFTMLDAKVFAPYIGFTENEVRKLCVEYNKDFSEVKRWYDGYLLSWTQIYNPKAVVSVMTWGDFQSYWSKTGTYESIVPLINMNFDGLKTAMIDMVAGSPVKVKTATYQNDMVTFKNKDDILTLLIHLGYVAYDSVNRTAFVPNEEIRQELIDAVEDRQWNEFTELQLKSEELLRATWDADCETVAQMIEYFHSEYTSAITYNNENSLSSVLSIAYLGALQYYFKPIREMPTGRGFADLVFIPKKEFPDVPAMILELKWNQAAETALRQIKEKKYDSILDSYHGNVLLVRINYDKKSKSHDCIIEQLVK